MKLKSEFQAPPSAPHSADRLSAVSRIGNPQSPRTASVLPNSIRRYGRLASCATLALAFAPSPLLACATCHGRSDSPLAHGMNAGIFTLMGVIGTVLACIALFFVHIARGEKVQNELNDNNPAPKNPSDV